MGSVNFAQPDWNGTLTSTLGTYFYGSPISNTLNSSTGLPNIAVSGLVPTVSSNSGDWTAKCINVFLAAPFNMAVSHDYALVDIVIINTNPNEYQLYMKRVKVREKQADELRDTVKEINNLKSEIREIKNLIKEIVK